MVTYRVEVGREHNVEPKHLVGAIANEAGLDSQNIGRISIMDDYSLIDMPEGMPRDIFQHLRKVWVNQKQLQISLAEDNTAKGGDRQRPTRKPARKPLKAKGPQKKPRPKRR